MSVYLELTHEFNRGERRAILSSGQAVVLHRLAIMSKDGDWILAERDEALAHVLSVLDAHGARYRFGAPLDRRWLAGGWSAHLEFAERGLRVRTDFVTRPPRLSALDLRQLWDSPEGGAAPYVDLRRLAELKKTARERDWAVIGELARRMRDPREQLLYSRSARDLVTLAERYPREAGELAAQRPLLELVGRGRDALETALDAERRQLMREDESRLHAYLQAAGRWRAEWPAVERETQSLPLPAAHALVVERALALLPFVPGKGGRADRG
jgi:hypothetical protein